MRKILFLLLALFFAVNAVNVKTGLYVLNIGKIDYSTGSFTADFYLDLICDSPCNPNFEFNNGRSDTSDLIINTSTEKFYRIQGTFNSKMDFKNFPFDQQTIDIILEDKTNPVSQLVYSWDRNESGLDPQVGVSGWNIENWSTSTLNHFYIPYNETYSQAIFSVSLKKPTLSAFVKTFLPVLFIVFITMLSFVLDLDKSANRITISSGALTATVLFHISIANQLPTITYLTYADKIMVLTYGFLLFSLVISVAFLELFELNKQETALKIHSKLEYNIFWIIPLVYLIAFLIF